MAIFTNENGYLRSISDAQGATSLINIDLIFKDITFNKNDLDGSYTLLFKDTYNQWRQYFVAYKKLGIIDISKYRKLILLIYDPNKISTTTWPNCKINNIEYGSFPESTKISESVYETDTNCIETYSKNFVDDNKQYPFGRTLASMTYYKIDSGTFGLPYDMETGEIYLRWRSDQHGHSFTLNYNYTLLGIFK